MGLLFQGDVGKDGELGRQGNDGPSGPKVGVTGQLQTHVGGDEECPNGYT